MACRVRLGSIEGRTKGRGVRGGNFEVFGDVDPRSVGHALQVRDSAPAAGGGWEARSAVVVPAL